MRAAAAAIGLAIVVAACSVDLDAHKQRTTEAACNRIHYSSGFCYGRLKDAGPTDAEAGTHEAGPGDGAARDGDVMPADGGDAMPPDARPPEACDKPNLTELCYSPEDKTTARQRPCSAGTRTCSDGVWTECIGEVTPKPEICDGVDNDCDGTFDEGQIVRDCNVKGVRGECAKGIVLCRDGAESCVQITFPASDVCDGRARDEDCDGKSDEGTEVPCFDGARGCTKNSDGEYECAPGSICAPGQLRCVGGTLQTSCTDDVEPRNMEVNTASGGERLDEDCDGKTDEGFSCAENATAKCYTGPSGTKTHSPCHEGEATCSGGVYGACVGEQLPVAESCANEGVDNDCDGSIDDVPLRNTSCASASTAQGACKANARWQCGGGSLTCVSGSAGSEVCDGRGGDEDCDGRSDEGFDLTSDENNCGSCGNKCPGSTTCCNGSCVDTNASNAHCGGCGRACGNGLTCCSRACVNLQSNGSNCGVCGRGCLLGCSNGNCNLL